MLKKAYIEITNRCNLRCSFCPGTKRAPRTMTPAEFNLVLERLTGQVEYVYLHVMGEPLSHPQLAELLALAAARERKVCITTNGTLLARQTETLLAARTLHKVSVSLHSFEGNDGTPERERQYWRRSGALLPAPPRRASSSRCGCGMRAARRRATARSKPFFTKNVRASGPSRAAAASACGAICTLSARKNSTGPTLTHRSAAHSSATACATSSACSPTARRCRAVSITRATSRWGICSRSRFRKFCKANARARCARAFRAAVRARSSAAAAASPRAFDR